VPRIDDRETSMCIFFLSRNNIAVTVFYCIPTHDVNDSLYDRSLKKINNISKHALYMLGKVNFLHTSDIIIKFLIQLYCKNIFL